MKEMKFMTTLITMLTVLIIMLSCTSKEREEEIVARKYCVACHAFPEPLELDKNTWNKVLPQMAFRMGLDISELMNIPEEDRENVMRVLPAAPMLSNAEYEAIKSYYLREAPDSLVQPPLFEATVSDQFEFVPMHLFNKRPTITMVRADTIQRKMYYSNREMKLYSTDFQFNKKDSLTISSPASFMEFRNGNEAVIALMGIMDPNDQPKGSIGELKGGAIAMLADSIKRPVFVDEVDLNNDQRKDLVVCAFGNYGGALIVYEKLEGNGYVPHVISSLPGARKVFVRDFDGDGLRDILALFTQGDEQVSMYSNAGSFRFRITTLLKFSPTDGSSYFDLADFNNDGYWDILYTNGDNADYSTILKPYHGIHIYTNNGKNGFTETFFQQFYGASMAVAGDFDLDGDQDITATSFFPDFTSTPDRSFIYLRNDNGKFIPFVTPVAAKGRWLIMEPVDIDADGDRDLILGALNFETGIPPELLQKWRDDPVDVMLLRNNQKK
jgi:hypothetical protein